jgi:hypothetical protein
MTMDRFGSGKPPASTGGRHADLAAGLVPFMGFTFVDAFPRLFMNAVDLVSVFALLLKDSSPDFQ